jgi:hypothetical protein
VVPLLDTPIFLSEIVTSTFPKWSDNSKIFSTIVKVLILELRKPPLKTNKPKNYNPQVYQLNYKLSIHQNRA